MFFYLEPCSNTAIELLLRRTLVLYIHEGHLTSTALVLLSKEDNRQ